MNQSYIAKLFAADWNGRGNEDADTHTFWLDLLRKIFGIEDSGKFIKFEKSVSFDKSTHKIDGYISKTKVLIEQKSFSNDLSAKYLQSDGTFLTPLEQAMRYADHLPYEECPRWIVTCNFAEFRVYYFGNIVSYFNPPEPVIIKLEDLSDDYERLKFLVDPDDTTILEDVNISKNALDIIKKVRDDFKDIYEKNNVTDWKNFLYKICVRLVFCFYADDSRLFDDKKYFAAYLQKFNGNAQIDALQNIFNVLNTPNNLRGNFDDALKKFPYVNGGLFAAISIRPLITPSLPIQIFIGKISTPRFLAQCLNLCLIPMNVVKAVCTIPASKIFTRLLIRFFLRICTKNLGARNLLTKKIVSKNLKIFKINWRR